VRIVRLDQALITQRVELLTLGRRTAVDLDNGGIRPLSLTGNVSPPAEWHSSENPWVLWRDFPMSINGVVSFRHHVAVLMTNTGELRSRVNECDRILHSDPRRDATTGYSRFDYFSDTKFDVSLCIAHDKWILSLVQRFRRFCRPFD